MDKPSNKVIKEIISRCNTPTPSAVDAKALQDLMENYPETIKPMCDVARQNLWMITSTSCWNYASREFLELELENKQLELGYATSPTLEKMLIDAVILSWLRWQTWERNYTAELSGDGMAIKKAIFWEKRLNLAQNRYLRAVEALARVRKMRPFIQVNIAEEGSQQVNVAGDLVKN